MNISFLKSLFWTSCLGAKRPDVFSSIPLFFLVMSVFSYPRAIAKKQGNKKPPGFLQIPNTPKRRQTPRPEPLKTLSRVMVHIGVSKNSGTPQIIHFNRVFHYKPSILGYPYFWKHPYLPRLRRVFYRTRDITQLPDGCGGRFSIAVGEIWGFFPQKRQEKTVVKVTLKKKEWAFWVIKHWCTGMYVLIYIYHSLIYIYTTCIHVEA